MARKYSRVKEPHRELKLDRRGGGWLQRGEDVRALQAAANRRLAARGMSRYQVAEDGIYGAQTALAMRKTIWALGALLQTIVLVLYRLGGQEGKLTIGAQRMIRYPGRRVDAQLQRARDRQGEIKKYNKRAKIKPATVRVVRRSMPGRSIFGRLGPIRIRAWHHSAGPPDTSDAHAIALCEQYARAHAAKGWGTIGYHGSGTRRGLLILFQDMGRLGAHVGGANTGSQGFMFHGNYQTDEVTAPQRALIRAVDSGALAAYGVPKVPSQGHNRFPGHRSNACPGRNITNTI